MFIRFNRLKYVIATLLVFILFLFLIFHPVIPQDIHVAVLLITGILILKTSKYGLLKNYFIK